MTQNNRGGPILGFRQVPIGARTFELQVESGDGGRMVGLVQEAQGVLGESREIHRRHEIEAVDPESPAGHAAISDLLLALEADLHDLNAAQLLA